MRIGSESLEEILRMIQGPVKVNGMWRTRHISERYTVCGELDIVKVIKVGRLRWLGQLCRMQDLDPCRKLTLLKPESAGRVGKAKQRRLQSAEEDLKKMGVTYW